MTKYYERIEDPEALVPRELSPLTGRRVRPSEAKRSQSGVPARPRPTWLRPVLVATALVLVVAVAAAAAVAATGDGDSTAANSRPGPTTAPTTSAEPDPPASEWAVVYGGGQWVERAAGSTGDAWPLFVRCDVADGCRVVPATMERDEVVEWVFDGPWRATWTLPFCGGAETMTYDLTPEGATTFEGFEMPARITGTETYRSSPADPNCATDGYVYAFDAVPERLNGTGVPVAVGG